MRHRVRLRSRLRYVLRLGVVALASACSPSSEQASSTAHETGATRAASDGASPAFNDAPSPLSGSTSAAAESMNVIQIVTFRFESGQSGAALRIFEEQALPLYRQNSAMLEFRAYREVESPDPLDLVVISRFEGMAGMDRSNEQLRLLAASAGTSIGVIYGGISEYALGHTDEFVEIGSDATLASMDAERLVVLEYLELEGSESVPTVASAPTAAAAGADAVALPTGLPGLSGGVGGPMVIADGWSHFRMYGVASLGTAQRVSHLPVMATIDGSRPVTRRKRLVLARVDALSVR